MNIAIVKIKQPLSIHVIWGILIIALLGIMRFMLPIECLFHRLTHIPCLSCGLCRAANACWSGDFGAMFYFNPLAVTFCVGLFLFSLLKLIEYILRLKIKADLSQKTAVFLKILFGLAAAADWLFLIVSKR
jgi:hypothetical protein